MKIAPPVCHTLQSILERRLRSMRALATQTGELLMQLNGKDDKQWTENKWLQPQMDSSASPCYKTRSRVKVGSTVCQKGKPKPEYSVHQQMTTHFKHKLYFF